MVQGQPGAARGARNVLTEQRFRSPPDLDTAILPNRYLIRFRLRFRLRQDTNTDNEYKSEGWVRRALDERVAQQLELLGQLWEADERARQVPCPPENRGFVAALRAANNPLPPSPHLPANPKAAGPARRG